MSGVQSCNKDLSSVAPVSTLTPNKINQLQTVFAKSLGQALKQDPELRAFLQTESLKQFDQDYDILYQMVKDTPINNGETLRERLIHYLPTDELASIEHQLPLLTIFIPTLPSGFSPETWHPAQEVPSIAVRQLNDGKTPLFNAVSGEQTIIEPGVIPGFPTLVVKQNERVVLSTNTPVLGEVTKPFYQNGQFSFQFSAPAYNGIQKSISTKTSDEKSKAAGSSRVGYDSQSGDGTFTMSYRNIQAYNIYTVDPSYQWQRDFVYYNLSPTTPKGRFRDSFRETIRAFRLSNAGIEKISGSSGNPTTPTIGSSNFTTNSWTDGRYEFLIVVLFNPKDGSPPQTNIRFSAKPSEVYDINYQIRNLWGSVNYYTVTSVTPKEFHPEIAIAAWDLSNFGTAWTYHVYEENQTVVHTEQQRVSTTYAANFEYDASFGAIVKSGVKFGANASTTNEKTVTLQFTEGSTDLGEKISYFYDPIIVNTTSRYPFSPAYNTYDLPTGGTAGNVYLSVEPYSLIPSENYVQ